MNWVIPAKNLTVNQRKRLEQLQTYVLKQRDLFPLNSKEKEIMVNIGSYILLIAGDE